MTQSPNIQALQRTLQRSLPHVNTLLFFDQGLGIELAADDGILTTSEQQTINSGEPAPSQKIDRLFDILATKPQKFLDALAIVKRHNVCAFEIIDKIYREEMKKPVEITPPSSHTSSTDSFNFTSSNSLQKTKTNHKSQGYKIAEILSFGGQKPKASDVFIAVENGNFQFILNAIGSGSAVCKYLAKLRAENGAKDNLLHSAMRLCQLDIARLILDKEGSLFHLFDVDAKNKNGDAALHLAAARGFVAGIDLLAEAGADLNLLGTGGDNLDFVKENVTYDDLFNRLSERYRNGFKDSALHQATHVNNRRAVERLLQLGADIKVVDSLNNSLLHAAARAGHEQLVDFYIGKGISIKCKGRHGRTPLHYAAINNRPTVVMLLLKKGADVETKQSDGKTALHLAASRGYSSMIKLLVDECKANIGAVTTSGKTPWDIAFENGNLDIINLLMR